MELDQGDGPSDGSKASLVPGELPRKTVTIERQRLVIAAKHKSNISIQTDQDSTLPDK